MKKIVLQYTYEVVLTDEQEAYLATYYDEEASDGQLFADLDIEVIPRTLGDLAVQLSQVGDWEDVQTDFQVIEEEGWR